MQQKAGEQILSSFRRKKYAVADAGFVFRISKGCLKPAKLNLSRALYTRIKRTLNMENLFYAPPENFEQHRRVEITGQEAKHISRVLRFEAGDTVYVSDGLGNIFTCLITQATKKSVILDISEVDFHEKPEAKKVLAFGAIKKRDRLEFAIEKAVEMDVWEICVFHADHSERSKINQERLQAIALSAFKQSKRYWLPNIVYLDSLDEVFNRYEHFKPVLAHMEAKVERPGYLPAKESLLLVGPEGGFSSREIELAKSEQAELISLGPNRLRAETAVIALLAQYLFDNS
jgi:16S rRNA (uracil1498-N3)-methyltransferase